ncbi:PEGA domain-containing protein [Sorangium sp. So ce315]|uniref:PEGA domain-containing protein n=1 Tax=Sorangium sp. So ce315 TaxID=3133299 RepID=UPI003F6197F8
MRPTPLVPLICLLGLLASPSPSEAQPESSAPTGSGAQAKPGSRPAIQRPPTGAGSEKARKLYLEGVALAEKNRWADAHASFVAAWALHEHYTILGGIGTCELMLKRYRDAAEHLAAYVREIDKDTTATPQDRAAAAETYAKARAHVGAVIVSTNVPGAQVVVDGSVVGTTPLLDPVFLDPGQHTITVRHEGYTPKEAAVEVAAGSEMQRAFELEKPEASAPPPPPPRPAPPPPRHEAKGPSVGVIVAGGSVAAAGVIAGVVFTLAANGTERAREREWNVVDGYRNGAVDCMSLTKGDPVEACRKLSSLVDDRDLFRNLALWSFVGAGVATVGTLGYWLASPSSAPEERHVRVFPLVTQGGGGIAAGGVF